MPVNPRNNGWVFRTISKFNGAISSYPMLRPLENMLTLAANCSILKHDIATLPASMYRLIESPPEANEYNVLFKTAVSSSKDRLGHAKLAVNERVNASPLLGPGFRARVPEFMGSPLVMPERIQLLSTMARDLWRRSRPSLTPLAHVQHVGTASGAWNVETVAAQYMLEHAALVRMSGAITSDVPNGFFDVDNLWRVGAGLAGLDFSAMDASYIEVAEGDPALHKAKKSDDIGRQFTMIEESERMVDFAAAYECQMLKALIEWSKPALDLIYTLSTKMGLPHHAATVTWLQSGWGRAPMHPALKAIVSMSDKATWVGREGAGKLYLYPVSLTKTELMNLAGVDAAGKTQFIDMVLPWFNDLVRMHMMRGIGVSRASPLARYLWQRTEHLILRLDSRPGAMDNVARHAGWDRAFATPAAVVYNNVEPNHYDLTDGRSASCDPVDIVYGLKSVVPVTADVSYNVIPYGKRVTRMSYSIVPIMQTRREFPLEGRPYRWLPAWAWMGEPAIRRRTFDTDSELEYTFGVTQAADRDEFMRIMTNPSGAMGAGVVPGPTPLNVSAGGVPAEVRLPETWTTFPVWEGSTISENLMLIGTGGTRLVSSPTINPTAMVQRQPDDTNRFLLYQSSEGEEFGVRVALLSAECENAAVCPILDTLVYAPYADPVYVYLATDTPVSLPYPLIDLCERFKGIVPFRSTLAITAGGALLANGPAGGPQPQDLDPRVQRLPDEPEEPIVEGEQAGA